MCIAYLSNEPSGVRRSQRPTFEGKAIEQSEKRCKADKGEEVCRRKGKRPYAEHLCEARIYQELYVLVNIFDSLAYAELF